MYRVWGHTLLFHQDPMSLVQKYTTLRMHAWTSKFYSNIKPLSGIPLFFASPHSPNISPLHCSFLILFHTTSATPLYPSYHAQVLLASAITVTHSTAPVTTRIKKIHFVQLHVTLKHSTLHKLTHNHSCDRWQQLIRITCILAARKKWYKMAQHF